MKYTDEQRAILALCRKYSKVHCSFEKDFEGRPVARLYIKPNWDRDDFVPYSEIEKWLKSHATLKQVGRPKGSVKSTSRRIKKTITLDYEQWAKADCVCRNFGFKFISHGIGHCIDVFYDDCFNS